MTLATMQQRLSEPFPTEQVRQFKKEWTNRAGEKKSAGPFDFIEDETVMDRLDDVVGLGNWYVHVHPITDAAVRVVLGVRLTGKDFIEYEDFGYATRADSAEPLKEAVSDGIRRCGRYVGIARYLYRKHDAGDIAKATAQADLAKQATAAGLIGVAEIGKPPADFELRTEPPPEDAPPDAEGSPAVAFRLKDGRKSFKVIARGRLAFELYAHRDAVVDQRVTCYGHMTTETFTPKDTKRSITYNVLTLERLFTSGLSLPTDEAVVIPDSGGASSVEPAAQTPGSPPHPSPQEAVGEGSVESQAAEATPMSADAEAPVAGADVPGAAPASICGSVSPYGDDERCTLLRGHKGPHKNLQAVFPTTWSER